MTKETGGPSERRSLRWLLNIFYLSARTVMKKKVVVPAALLTAVLAAGGLLYFTYARPLEKPAAAPAPPSAVPIVAGAVPQHDVPVYLSGVGTVEAYDNVVVP